MKRWLIMGLWLPLLGWGQAPPSEVAAIYARLADYLALPTEGRPVLRAPLPVDTRGAFYDPMANAITLDQPLLDRLRARLSPTGYRAAVALLLGHELGHYWQQADCQAAQLIGLPGQMPTNDPRWRTELEADYYGSFAVHLAELDDPAGMETALALLLRDPSGRYPPRALRDSVVVQARTRVAALLDTYRLGLCLSLVEAHAEAKACFAAMNREFGSRKVLTLLALSEMHLAMAASEQHRFRYGYPFERDPLSRLERGVRVPLDRDPATVRRYLTQAEGHLRAALQLDPTYAAAQRNLLCLYLMQRRLAEARQLWAQVLPPPGPETDLLRGLLAALQGDTATARKHWEGWAKRNPPHPLSALAAQNLRVLRGQIPERRDRVPRRSVLVHPAPGWQQARREAEPFLTPLGGQPTLRRLTGAAGTWLCWGDSLGVFFPASPKALPGLSLGSDWQTVERVLGPADQVGGLTQGAYAVFWDHGLLLWLDAQQRLQRWTYWAMR